MGAGRIAQYIVDAGKLQLLGSQPHCQLFAMWTLVAAAGRACVGMDAGEWKYGWA